MALCGITSKRIISTNYGCKRSMLLWRLQMPTADGHLHSLPNFPNCCIQVRTRAPHSDTKKSIGTTPTASARADTRGGTRNQENIKQMAAESEFVMIRPRYAQSLITNQASSTIYPTIIAGSPEAIKTDERHQPTVSRPGDEENRLQQPVTESYDIPNKDGTAWSEFIPQGSSCRYPHPRPRLRCAHRRRIP